MKKTIRPFVVVSKLIFIVAFVAALALTVSWVAGSHSKASAAPCEVIGAQNCIDITDNNDCIPNADHGCTIDCTPNADTNCQCLPNSENNCSDCVPNSDNNCSNDQKDPGDQTDNSTPQVLGTSTTADPTFTGK